LILCGQFVLPNNSTASYIIFAFCDDHEWNESLMLSELKLNCSTEEVRRLHHLSSICYSTFNYFLEIGVCWTQPCYYPGRLRQCQRWWYYPFFSAGFSSIEGRESLTHAFGIAVAITFPFPDGRSNNILRW
jgi:hypothetical protein